MTGQNPWSQFCPNFFTGQSEREIMWEVLIWLKSRLRLVTTGTLGFAMILVTTNAGMDSAVSVEDNIEPRKSARVTLLSKLAAEKELAQTTRKVEDLLQVGPRPLDQSLKRKRDEVVDIPRYRRRFVWSKSFPDTISPAAQSTVTAVPLPSPPQHLMEDPDIACTMKSLTGFVRVDTPFNVDRFEAVLHDHPNQPFVKSVVRGLREGFWPFEEGDWDQDNVEIFSNFTKDESDIDAVRAFRDKEVLANRWSLPLTQSELLPGMKTSPMFVVWQKDKARVITDHSASGLNDGIPRSEAKVKYDDMRSFGQILYNARRRFPGRRLVTWKSDVASAFLNLPAHPLWQLRQVVQVDGNLYIVRRLVFGNRASPRIWCSVSGLLCWIAVTKLDIDGTHVYMDDFFGWDFADNLAFYHGKLRPRRQVQLLVLWDFVSCPFEDRKQEHGESLKILGFWVDPNLGSISLSADTVDNIIAHINSFLGHESRCPPLRDWQRLAGHLNWLLNVLPWGRPALSILYSKMSGKSMGNRGIFINRDVRQDMSWLADVIPRSIGIRFVDSLMWGDEEADMIVWSDACLRGLGFCYAGSGFVYQIQPSSIPVDIFFFELVAILSAVSHVAAFHQPPRHLLVFTDSLDSVCVLNTLSASQELHNAPLRAISEVVLTTGIDLRVRHIPGADNIRADLLSRLLVEDYQRLFPSHRVRPFTPPRELLPARWRECF